MSIAIPEDDIQKFVGDLAEVFVKRRQKWYNAISRVQEAYHNKDSEVWEYAMAMEIKEKAEARWDQMKEVEKIMPVMVEIVFKDKVREIEDRGKQS